jgi:hypothetical protein
VSQEALAITEPDLQGEIIEWDVTQEEPEFEFYIRCERVTGGSFPHSEWHAAHSVEGEPHGTLSESQRLYMAAVLKHGAHSIEGGILLPSGDTVRIVAEAREARRQLRAAMDMLYNTVRGLVEMKGEAFAAHALGMKERQVRHLLKSRRLELQESEPN